MASLYARDSSAVGFCFSCLRQFTLAADRSGFHVPISSATGYNTSRNELLAIPLPCSRFSTEPCFKHPWTEYHKCASFRAFAEYTFLCY
jgi:hypothetical protein